MGPIEKRFCPVTRLLPEMQHVPARAILSSKEQERVKSVLERQKEWIECTMSETDGMILRALQHPRGADRDAHLARCVTKLQSDLSIDATEAEQRLKSDEKFLQFWSVLPIVEKGSADETTCERSLRARTRILTDAHHVGNRVSATWQEARDAMQSVKWYRHMLGSALAPNEVDAEDEDLSDLQACLDAIVEAWPNMD